MRHPRTAALAAVTLLAGAAAGASVAHAAGDDTATDSEVGTIVVGSANFPESELLAQIYGQALADAGFDVEYQLGIGSREVYFNAIHSGEIHLVPEYTGSLLSLLLRPELPDAADVDEQLAALAEALPDGLEVLTPSVAEDKDTIVCTADVAAEYDLATLGDLAANAGELTLGAPPEFEERTPFGLVGFSELLDAEFAEFVPLAFGDIPAALQGGAIDCGNMFSTSSSIVAGGFVALEDDHGLVPAENVLPLIRSEIATAEVVAVLDDVSSRLDTATLTDLVAQVELDALGPDVVAADWLASDPPVIATLPATVTLPVTDAPDDTTGPDDTTVETTAA